MGVRNKNSAGLSKILAIAIALALAVVAVSGIYFVTSAYFHGNGASNISVEALSLNTSSSNLSSTVNVNSQSPLVGMDLYINGTLIGHSNYSWAGSTMMGNGIPLTTRNWNNGTYDVFYFSSVFSEDVSNSNDRRCRVQY